MSMPKIHYHNLTPSLYTLCIGLLFSILLFGGCAGESESEDFITSVNFEEAEFAPFVEPDFPFITTSMDGRNLGSGFPEDNIAARVLAIKLGEDAYLSFDTDMLRWSVAWTGEFMPMVTMAQISYQDFHNKDNLIPTISGEPKITTGLYPGWNGSNPQFTDPRPAPANPDMLAWGPLPTEIGRWNGLYLNDGEVVLSYSVKGVGIFEKPGSIKINDETGFIRTISTQGSREELTMVAAEVTNGTRSEIRGNSAYIYHGENEESITAVGFTEEIAGVTIDVIADRYIVLSIAAGNNDLEFNAIIWKGSTAQTGTFEQMLSDSKPDMPEFIKGGSSPWNEEVLTRGQISPDTAAFVTDLLTLPIPNPWKRNVRVVDVAFFGGSRAAVVTFEGDVWLVDGIDDDLKRLSWKRFASGLYEPQSIEVIDNQVYIFGKEGIVRFHDLNDDGAADYYENFSNLMVQSIETREWASDMVHAPDSSFYISKFGALDMGPETSSPKSLMGFRAGSPHDGSILKISADGRQIETYATGFRGPYIGIHPETGVLSASDQQGNYMPSTPVMLVGKGDYYGVPATAHLDPIPDVTPPLAWLPHRVDRSGISQVWVTSDKMGPLNGEMIHMSYGRPGLFRVTIDSTGKGVQGGISLLKGHYPAPTMKGVINPTDGQLYVTGFSLWGTNTSTISALLRIRYTGMESHFPEKFYVRDGGIVIKFDTPLDEETAKDPGNYIVKRWNYERTEKYGSGHFKLDGTAGEDILPVVEVGLSDDRKSLFIAVPDIKVVMQMEVSYNLKSEKGATLEDVLWFTINDVVEPDLPAEGFSEFKLDEISYDYDAQLALEKGNNVPTLALGSQLFLKMGCIACHAVDQNSEGKIGPGMVGLFHADRPLKDGTTVIADEAYIKESILNPGEKEVEGFEEGMPSFLGILSETEIESLVLYIKSL